MKLFLGNLSYQTREEELYDLLREYGHVEYIKLVTDKETGHSKGYAFFKMHNESEAKVVTEELNNQFFMGRKLLINEAFDKESKNSSSEFHFNKKKKKKHEENGKGYYQKSLS
jgi:RNA recognition motif-containing protein